MGIDTATTFQKIAAPISAVCVILHVVGYATHSWGTVAGGLGSIGLWEGCRLSECQFISGGTPGLAYLQGVRVTESFGLLGLVVSCVCCMLLLFRDDLRRPAVERTAILSSIIAELLILIGVVIYGAKFIASPVSVGYSMVLVIIAGVLSILVTVLIGVDCRRRAAYASLG